MWVMVPYRVEAGRSIHYAWPWAWRCCRLLVEWSGWCLVGVILAQNMALRVEWAEGKGEERGHQECRVGWWYRLAEADSGVYGGIETASGQGRAQD